MTDLKIQRDKLTYEAYLIDRVEREKVGPEGKITLRLSEQDR